MRPAVGQPLTAAVRCIAAAGLVGVAGILAWQILDDDATPDATTLGLLVLAIVSLTALLQPRPFAAGLARVKSLDLLGVKVELEVERVRSIARRFPEKEDGVTVESRPRGETPDEDVDKVAYELRRKLQFVRKAVLGDPDSLAEELVVARLEYLEILERDEAHLCHQLLGDLRDTIEDWDDAERDTFLDGAWQFAFRLATEMFDRFARRALAKADWFVADFEQPGGHRADFLVMHDSAWALAAARVAAPPGSIDGTVSRLARAGDPLPDAPRLILVPDHVDHLPPQIDPGPLFRSEGAVMVLRLRRLLDEPGLITPESATST